MKKQSIAIFGTAIFLALGMAACTPKASETDKPVSPAVTDNSVSSALTDNSASSATAAQVPNPVTEYATIEEAQTAAGFTIKVPSAPEGYEVSRIAVIAGTEGVAVSDGEAGADSEAGIGAPGGAKTNPIIEITYSNGSEEITYRTAQGDGSDLSGDYEEYAESNTLTVGDVQVETRGAEGKVSVATWSSAGLDHSLTGNGLAAGDVEAAVGSVQ